MVHQVFHYLTHWGRVTHICVGKLTTIGSDNGLSLGRRQAIIWTNAGILLIGPIGTNFNEMLIEIHAFSFAKIHLKMSSGKWRPFCLGLNVLMNPRGLLTIVSWNEFGGKDHKSRFWQAHLIDKHSSTKTPANSSHYFSANHCKVHMGQVMELRLSCYLVLLSIDSKTR